MAEEWDDERALNLIQRIKMYPVLWDPKQKHTARRWRKHQIYGTLAKEFNVTVQEIKKKVRNLIQSYRTYRRRILHKSRGLEIFKPTWFAFDAINEFMGNVYTPLSVKHADEELASGPENPIEEEKQISHAEDYSFNNYDVAGVNGLEAAIPENTRVSLKRSFDTHKYTVPKRKKDASFNNPRTDETPNFSFWEAKEKRTSSERDECSLFGELIAVKLRKMDELTRQYAMNDIYSVMFRAAMKISGRTAELASTALRPSHFSLSAPKVFKCERSLSSSGSSLASPSHLSHTTADPNELQPTSSGFSPSESCPLYVDISHMKMERSLDNQNELDKN